MGAGREGIRLAGDRLRWILVTHTHVDHCLLAARLQQIVWNLLSNAIKFSRAGGRVELDARKRGEYFPQAWQDKLSIDDAHRIQLGVIRRRCTAEGQRRPG